MKRKIKYYLLILLLILLTSCETQIEQQAPRTLVELDLILGFTPNVAPMINPDLTSPRPGLRGVTKNETVLLEAKNSDRYIFQRWEVKPANENTYESFQESHEINLTKNHVVKVFFGCAKDEACIDRYMCEEGHCVPSNRLNAPPFTPAYSELGNEEDRELIIDVINELQYRGYINIRGPFRFSTINASQLDNRVTLGILLDKAVIVTGANSPRSHEEFAREIRDILEELGKERNKIKKITSNQITDERLYNIFN